MAADQSDQSDRRATALARLRELGECLRGAADRPAAAGAVEECEHLVRAVEAFHPEGVRFRLYGLRRRLTADDGEVPAAAVRLLEAAREALHAAGFKTG